ncbi:MAG: hypothetical protein AB1705_28435 [Verrucomicrobiota bacterium]
MNPTPEQFGAWFSSLALLVSVLANLYLIFASRTSQKREISFTDTYATREEHVALKREVKNLEAKIDQNLAAIRSEMKQDRDAMLLAGEERAAKIHDRVNKVLEAVSELKGRVYHD